ncbi:lipoyl(octanoyl) transferase LipB [candidate division WOR-3 bacterium]|nr:lipoyl(octanoyl) transferase LipB [candidate division WOR-3 bacterium]
MAAGLLVNLGLADYAACLGLQRRLWDLRVRDEIPDTLVLVEHPPVVTLGRSARLENVLVSEAELARLGIALHRVERGGDVTFHGPGQLVGYPIFRLDRGFAGVKQFVGRLESAVIAALAQLGITARVRPSLTGVWVEERKIASIGIAVKRWVTLHGFALNVTTDLGCFRLINPCGMAHVQVTSVEREGGRTDRARRAIASGFSMVFGLGLQSNLPRRITVLTNDLKRSAIASAAARL